MDSSTENYSNHNIKNEYKEWLLQRLKAMKAPIWITFSFIGNEKQAISQGEERFRTLIHRISRQFNKNKYRKKKELIDFVAVKEHDELTRFNIHSVIDRPEKYTEQEITGFIRDQSKELFNLIPNDERTPELYIGRYDLNETINYFLKKRSKDWRNQVTENVIL